MRNAIPLPEFGLHNCVKWSLFDGSEFKTIQGIGKQIYFTFQQII